MHHSIVKTFSEQIIRPALPRSMIRSRAQPPSCDIFINHRGIDTKRTIAGLLFNHLKNLGFSPFLDSKSMKPGDKLFDKIDPAIRDCKVGVAVFSPRYCESYFCLHELSLMIQCKRKVIPIFCDVKPSELVVTDNGIYPGEDLEMFRKALEEAKLTVGVTFDTHKADWSEFLINATAAIIAGLQEVEETSHSARKISCMKWD